MFGFLFGFPALRLSGIYLALATFSLAVAMPQFLKLAVFEHWTGGVQGLVVTKPDSPFGLPMGQDMWLYYFTLAVSIAIYLASVNLLRSRSGRAFMAIRDNEIAASAMGVDVEVITGGPLFGDMRFPTTDLACHDTTVIKSPYMRDLVYRTQGRRGLGRLGVAMLHTDEEWFCKIAWQHVASTAGRRRPDIVHAHALHQAARLKTIDVPVAINLP